MIVFLKLTASVYIPAAVVKMPWHKLLTHKGFILGAQFKVQPMRWKSPSNKSLRRWPEASIIKKLGVMNACDGCSLSSLYTVQNLSLANSVTCSRVEGPSQLHSPRQDNPCQACPDASPPTNSTSHLIVHFWWIFAITVMMQILVGTGWRLRDWLLGHLCCGDKC